MKKIILLLLPLFLVSSFTIAGSYSSEAPIVSVERIYQDRFIKEPYQECYIKEFYQNKKAISPLGGALLGGLIGNSLSKKKKKKKNAAIIGALLGASMAQNAQSNSGNIIRKEVCETKYRRITSSRLAHYLVKYEFNGQIFSYTTQYKPSSETIKVQIQVSPE